MTSSHDLHPVRWSQTRSFAKPVLKMLRKRGGFNEETCLRLYNIAAAGAIQSFNAAIVKVPVEQRHYNSRMISDEVGTAMSAALWFMSGRNAFALSDGLHQALSKTDLSGVRASDVRFPFDNLYISLADRMSVGLPGSDNVIDGAYVVRHAEGLTVNLTTRALPNPEGPQGWPFRHEATFDIPLAYGDGDPTFEELLQKAIETKEIDIFPPSEMPKPVIETVRFDGRDVEVHRVADRNDALAAEMRRDAMPVVRETLALIINTLAWLTAKPEEASAAETWTSDAPIGRVEATRTGPIRMRQVAETDLLNNRFAKVRILGSEIEYVPPGARTADGRELSESFWRRGHWRRQPHGAMRMLRRLQWLRPTLVRPDLGEPAEGRIYSVGPDTPAPALAAA